MWSKCVCVCVCVCLSVCVYPLDLYSSAHYALTHVHNTRNTLISLHTHTLQLVSHKGKRIGKGGAESHLSACYRCHGDCVWELSLYKTLHRCAEPQPLQGPETTGSSVSFSLSRSLSVSPSLYFSPSLSLSLSTRVSLLIQEVQWAALKTGPFFSNSDFYCVYSLPLLSTSGSHMCTHRQQDAPAHGPALREGQCPPCNPNPSTYHKKTH